MLARLSEVVLRWGFASAWPTLTVIQVVYVPARAILTVTRGGIALFLLGCLCGFLAGLLGIMGSGRSTRTDRAFQFRCFVECRWL